MMKKKLIVLLAVAFVAGCKKKEEVICIADTGGNHTLTIKLLKDGVTYISSANAKAKAYVAFEQFEVAGFSDSSYDLVKVADDNEDFIRFNNLTCGIYYCKLRVIDPVTGKTYSGTRIVTINSDTPSAESSIDMVIQ